MAQALPDWEDRQAVVRASALRDVQMTGAPEVAWRLMVDEALLQGRFLPLVRSAASRAPDHVGLQRFAAGLERGELRLGLGLWPLAAGAAAMIAGGLLGWWAVTSPRLDPSPRIDPDAVAVPAARPEAQPEPEAPGDGAAAEAGSEGTDQGPQDRGLSAPAVDEPPPFPPEPEGATEPEPPPPPPEAAQTRSAAPATPPVERARSGASDDRAEESWPDRCAGFAWMGSSTDLRAGDVWELDQPTNVRADYPRAENGWNPRSRRVCGLTEGRRLRLGEDPIQVDGGAVWVRVDEEWLLPR